MKRGVRERLDDVLPQRALSFKEQAVASARGGKREPYVNEDGVETDEAAYQDVAAADQPDKYYRSAYGVDTHGKLDDREDGRGGPNSNYLDQEPGGAGYLYNTPIG